MNEELKRKEISWNTEKSDENTRKMNTRSVRSSMNKEAAFEGVKEIIENTFGKINKVEHKMNKDQ